MIKVLCDGLMYERVLYDQESHFESVAKSQLRILLPDFFILPFKMFVQGEEGLRRKPDLAIVHKECGAWAVVEVELAHHSLERHVYPQMQCFATGHYSDKHAEYLANKEDSLSFTDVSRMIKYVEPRIMVLVNSTDVLAQGWDCLSQELGVKMAFLEVFRSANDRVVFNFSGYLPNINAKRIAGGRKLEMINALRCRPIDYFEKHPGDLIVYVDDRPIPWRTLTTGDAAILTPRHPVELSGSRNYEITQSADGRLHLKVL